MTQKLRAAATAALARPRFNALINLIPREERDDPRALLGWLTTAAEFDRKGADSDEFGAAYGALTQLVAFEDLQTRIAAAYHDPRLRAKYGVEAIERAWNDPATAKQILLAESAAGKLTPEADTALNVIYQAEAYAAEQGTALPQPAAKPIPTGAEAQDGEYRELIARSATGRLGAADEARLNALAEAKAGREAQQEAAAEAAGGRKVPISKSVSGGQLSPAESARLDYLAGDRAVEAGLVTAEDIEVEREYSE